MNLSLVVRAALGVLTAFVCLTAAAAAPISPESHGPWPNAADPSVAGQLSQGANRFAVLTLEQRTASVNGARARSGRTAPQPGTAAPDMKPFYGPSKKP